MVYRRHFDCCYQQVDTQTALLYKPLFSGCDYLAWLENFLTIYPLDPSAPATIQTIQQSLLMMCEHQWLQAVEK